MCLENIRVLVWAPVRTVVVELPEVWSVAKLIRYCNVPVSSFCAIRSIIVAKQKTSGGGGQAYVAPALVCKAEQPIPLAG